ncbi:DUF4974 domain-containing protein [Puteibacter caeruleilacunae]|nr:DUF4974 domain-containing protein [Puteibacter caeruleilacunae]
MIKNDIKERFDRYLNNKANAEDEVHVTQMLGAEHETEGLQGFVKDDWDHYWDSEEKIDKDLSGVLGRLHHIIYIRSQKKRTITRKLYHWYSVAAAVIVIPLLITTIYTLSESSRKDQLINEQTSMVAISAPRGVRMTFELPDGTNGVLNGGSELQYQVPFSHNRNVSLSGEAFFDVAHDKAHAFHVKTDQLQVKVLGTKFNVNAYAEEQAEVVLLEGKVACTLTGEKDELLMRPNERILVQQGKGIKTQVDALEFIAWKDGWLTFRKDNMTAVARKISQWYDVDVEVADQELNRYRFRGTFQNDSLEEMLRLLSLTSSIDYEIIENKPLSDGRFSKRKVIIRMAKQE